MKPLRRLQTRWPFWLQRLVRSAGESADYRAWRHQFLIKRLRLCGAVALIGHLVYIPLHFFYGFVLHRPETIVSPIYQAPLPPAAVQALWQAFWEDVLINGVVAGLLIAIGVLIWRSPWGRRYPIVLLLALGWTFTLVPQVIWLGRGNLVPPGMAFYFLVQAVLLPVHWRLHLLSQVGALGVHFGGGALLGALGWLNDSPLSTYALLDSANLLLFFYLGLSVLLCNLGVGFYERLQRRDFESRRQLRLFLHAVTHDLQTPLMGTAIVLQNLLRQVPPGQAQAVVPVAKLEQLLAGSHRQLDLVQSLLAAHRAETQTLTLHRAPVSLAEVVAQVCADLEGLMGDRHTTLVNRIDPNLPPLDGDAAQLRRLFANLMGNAIAHNPDPVQLTLEARLLPAAGEQSSSWVRCTVADNGIGIPPEHCPHIFELYWQSPRQRYAPGLGLGLYLCRQIAIAHGGQIEVVSGPGGGASFWFTLPTAVTPAQSATPPLPPAPGHPQPACS